MDRPLDGKYVRNRFIRRMLRIVIPLGIILGILFLITSLIRPSINRKDLRTAVVQRGRIEGTISASGTIVPIYEQAISSPVETRLLSVRHRPGDIVKKGQSVLELDPSELTLEMERAEKELKLAENRKEQLRLDIEGTLNGLDGQLNIKNLRLEYLSSKKTQGERMLNIGAISKDQLDQIKLDEQIATIEKAELEKSIQSTKLSLQNQLDGVTAEVHSLLKEKSDIQRQLKLLGCEADRDGVITWIRDEIGSSIHRGDIVLKIADLTSYRVEAILSDIHSSRLSSGMPALVRLSDTTLAGRLETIYPNVENGTVRIGIFLEQPSYHTLRPNLRAEVSLITNRRDSVLILKKGSYLTGGDHQVVFVIQGNTAIRTPITTGVIGFETVEITGGLSEGDEVILSDMTDELGRSEVTIH
jgi:HlyD family secretion protein